MAGSMISFDKSGLGVAEKNLSLFGLEAYPFSSGAKPLSLFDSLVPRGSFLTLWALFPLVRWSWITRALFSLWLDS